MIAEAQGEAEATLKRYEAQAKGIQMIKEADPSSAYLTLKGLKPMPRLPMAKQRSW